MASGDIFAVDFFQSVHGNPVMSTLHYLQTVNETDPGNVGQSLIEGFASAVGDAWAVELSEDWKGDSISIRRLWPTPINPQTFILTGAEAIVGAIAAEAIPSNAPMVVTKYTDVATKRGRGRWYQSGIPENAQDCGQILAAKMTDFQTAAAGLSTELAELAGGAGRWSPVVVSNAAGPPPLATAIQYITVRPNIANMRPRRSVQSTV